MGLVRDTVEWRGHELRVLPGTVIDPASAETGAADAPSAAG